MRRRGTSLVEILMIAVPALLVLALAVQLLARGAAAERWNAGRLAALDAVLIAAEELRADLAVSTGVLEVTPGALWTGTARWTALEHGTLARDGRPLRAAPLAAARWSCDTTSPALVHLELEGDAHVALPADVLVPDRAARDAWPAFADH